MAHIVPRLNGDRPTNDLAALTAGLVTVPNRAVMSWGFTGQCPDCSAILINTDTGAVVSSYSGTLFPIHFDCTGSRLIIDEVGMVDTSTGALVAAGVVDTDGFAFFSCPRSSRPPESLGNGFWVAQEGPVPRRRNALGPGVLG